MSTRVIKTVFILTVVALVFGVAVSEAEAQVNAVSGKATIKYSKREVLPVGDTEGHILLLGEASGANINTGKWDFMNGATATSRSTADLTKGTGTQSGYFIISNDKSQTVAKYTGTVKTILSPDGKPLTSLSGEWKYVKCTGAFEGCTGQGVYQGNFLSENEIAVEYKGILVQ